MNTRYNSYYQICRLYMLTFHFTTQSQSVVLRWEQLSIICGIIHKSSNMRLNCISVTRFHQFTSHGNSDALLWWKLHPKAKANFNEKFSPVAGEPSMFLIKEGNFFSNYLLDKASVNAAAPNYSCENFHRIIINFDAIPGPDIKLGKKANNRDSIVQLNLSSIY